jgi:group II intron reverse transcriptase/maturase
MSSRKPRQLLLPFADSPKGGDASTTADESASKSLDAAHRKQHEPDGIRAEDASRAPALLEMAASLENLETALMKVVQNAGAPGVDRQTVKEVEKCSAELLPKLRDALLTETYVPGDIRRVWIPKPNGGQRGLGIPNVIDRWVQQAVLQVLEPIFEPTFHENSHGFRPGRSTHTAIAQAQQYLKRGRRYTVDLDLKNFFDRVNHQRLLDRMAQKVWEPAILRLVRLMLKAKVVMPDGTKVLTEEGTPQGGPLSPLLSNIVLDELDRELERRKLCFVRYADDCNIYVSSERAGHRVMASITRFIEQRLRLQVNAEKSAVADAYTRHFLGFRLGIGADGQPIVNLSERTEMRLAAKIRELTPRTWGQSLDACIEEVNSYLRGWMGHFHPVTKEALRVLGNTDAHVRRRLRAIIVRHKKKDRYLFRNLLKEGATPRSAATTAFSSRGTWAKSAMLGMHQAYGNAWFAETKRLFSLLGNWWKRRLPKPERSPLLSSIGKLFRKSRM